MQNKSEKPLIGLVDMDGVIVDFMMGWLKGYKEKFGEQLGYPTKFWVEEAFPQVTKQQISDVIDAPGFFRNLDPIPGAIESLESMLECGIEVFICTKPRKSVHSITEKAEWIEHWLGPKWVQRYIPARDKTLVIGDFLVDDEPEKKGMEPPCWLHVIFDQLYNREGKEDYPYRITWKTWPRIYQYVEKESGKKN